MIINSMTAVKYIYYLSIIESLKAVIQLCILFVKIPVDTRTRCATYIHEYIHMRCNLFPYSNNNDINNK